MVLFPCALLLAIAPQQDPRGSAEQLVVDAQGAQVVVQFGPRGETVPPPGPWPASTGDLVQAPRWIETDDGEYWICKSVAAGDDGASIFAGKSLNNEAASLSPGGDVTAIVEVDADNSEIVQVVVADRAAAAAGYTVVDVDPSPGVQYVGTVSAWSTNANGFGWARSFPGTASNYQGGVAISDDAEVILAWKSDPGSQALLVKAFRGDGSLISEAAISVDDGGLPQYQSRKTILSDDGSRAYFSLGEQAVLYDVPSAAVIYQHGIGATFDSHALSGDGRTFAFGRLRRFEVWKEAAPGNWQQEAFRNFPNGTFVSRMDLNQDGSRLGYLLQHFGPEDRFDVALYGLSEAHDLFTHTFSSPGTIYQLVGSGIELDDNGEVLAGTSWGDSFNATPEVFAFDAEGSLTCALDLQGSAMDLGLDADGDVLAVGSKALHANQNGSGGAVLAVDAQVQELHLAGVPRSGSIVRLRAAATGDLLRVSVCRFLKAGTSFYGPTEVDLDTQVQMLGPAVIPAHGLDRPLLIPANPALIGRIFHYQGGIASSAGRHGTNKVSVRILRP